MLTQISGVQHLAYTSNLSEMSNFMAVFSTSGCLDKSREEIQDCFLVILTRLFM